MINNSYVNNKGDDFSEYIENRIDIGLFFFFVACAGVSIIVWAFNWICWLNQCCCCDFLHNPVNKRIAWWISFTFLLGMLSFCICAFVSVNRFGFALEGAWCSLDRIYYDFKNGQLKASPPRWIGLQELKKALVSFKTFETSINPQNAHTKLDLTEVDPYYASRYNKIYQSYEDLREIKQENPNSLTDAFDELTKIFTDDDKIKEFDKLKDILKRNFFDKGNTMKICMKILSMVYYCLFLITITFSGISMMFYACLKRQGYLMTLMHIFWNIIRFFMFSFFIFGAFYGIFSLALKDYVAAIQYFFSSRFADKEQDRTPTMPKIFLEECNKNKYNFADLIDEKIKLSLNEFLTYYQELNSALEGDDDSSLGELKKYLGDLNCKELAEKVGQKGGLFGSFNCGFLENDLNIVYLTLYEASKESEKLSGFSLSASFFGAVSVYFYLLVMHHYNNELFFDSGKSIFTGFDGFGGGYKKKNRNQDPAYKKRKLRAEIELTSKNDNDEEQ